MNPSGRWHIRVTSISRRICIAKEGDKYVFCEHASEAQTQQTTHYLEIFLVEALETFWLLFERDPIYAKT
jgi:hypothetical protein